jgi:hypothetical protein
MSNQIPAVGRVTDSGTGGSAAGVLPPLLCESVALPGTETEDARRLSADGSPVESLQAQLDALADDVLEKATIELRRSINAAHARFAVQVRELDRRSVPELEHRLSTSGWLRRFCDMSPAEASGTVKTARAMTHMPTAVAHALSGVISPRSIQLLGQARDRHPSQFQDHEEVFADIATYLTTKDLSRAIAHWEQQVNYPEALGDVERRDRRRSLYLAEMLDGMGDIKGSLTPDLFHVVNTAVNAKMNPTFLDTDDRRTPTQRRADALGDICRFYLDHNDTLVTSSGEKPHVTFTVDYETLKGTTQRLPEIDGKSVTPATVRRITCDAGIIPMVLGSDSEPLDIGRKTRTIPTGIRRALEHRDMGCAWIGCGAPVSWCDAHHLIHWADGGPTSLNNLALLCRKHHTATHNGQKPPPDT